MLKSENHYILDNYFRLHSEAIKFHLFSLFQQFNCHVTSTRSHLQNHICGPQCSLKDTKCNVAPDVYQEWCLKVCVCVCVSEHREAEHTFSIIELTIKGFFRMCWPMPVLNMIPVTDVFRSFNQYHGLLHACAIHFLMQLAKIKIHKIIKNCLPTASLIHLDAHRFT